MNLFTIGKKYIIDGEIQYSQQNKTLTGSLKNIVFTLTSKSKKQYTFTAYGYGGDTLNYGNGPVSVPIRYGLQIKPVKVLVLGATGMLGHVLFTNLVRNNKFEAFGTIRSEESKSLFSKALAKKLLLFNNINNDMCLSDLFSQIRPNIVINCIGIVKQSDMINDKIETIMINSIFPQKLAEMCDVYGAKLIHISTDCVFSGENKLPYTEMDEAVPEDIYGQTKLLGEVNNFSNALTIRTSIIGPELRTKQGLLEWLLSREDKCAGFSMSLFSGFPTCVFADILENIVLNRQDLKGLYHIASDSISKYDLLVLINKEYEKNISIIPSSMPITFRVLDSRKFIEATGFRSEPWPTMIKKMHDWKFQNV
jgi:dTDP-4-dehydrorhamnose reductase